MSRPRLKNLAVDLRDIEWTPIRSGKPAGGMSDAEFFAMALARSRKFWRGHDHALRYHARIFGKIIASEKRTQVLEDLAEASRVETQKYLDALAAAEEARRAGVDTANRARIKAVTEEALAGAKGRREKAILRRALKTAATLPAE